MLPHISSPLFLFLSETKFVTVPLHSLLQMISTFYAVIFLPWCLKPLYATWSEVITFSFGFWCYCLMHWCFSPGFSFEFLQLNLVFIFSHTLCARADVSNHGIPHQALYCHQQPYLCGLLHYPWLVSQIAPPPKKAHHLHMHKNKRFFSFILTLSRTYFCGIAPFLCLCL